MLKAKTSHTRTKIYVNHLKEIGFLESKGGKGKYKTTPPGLKWMNDVKEVYRQITNLSP